MSKDLTVVKIGAIPEVVFSPDTVKMSEVKEKYPISKIPTDLTVEDNYNLVKDGARAHQKTRTKIEADHKNLKAPYRDVGLQLDKAKNLMLEELKPIENAYKTAKQDHDDIETKRIEAIEREKQEAVDKIINRISWLNGYPSRLIGKPSTEVSVIIEELKSYDLEWAGEMVESAKNTVSAVLVNLESLHAMQAENENAERIAEEERVKREAEEKKLAEERAIEKKKLEDEREVMEAEKAQLQAEKDLIQEEKDKIERENEEAKAGLERLKTEAKEKEDNLKAEKLAEEQRIKGGKEEAKRQADIAEEEKKAKAKALKAEEALAKKLAKEVDGRRKETLDALVKILRSDKLVAVVASEILGKIESGDVPNLTFIGDK